MIPEVGLEDSINVEITRVSDRYDRGRQKYGPTRALAFVDLDLADFGLHTPRHTRKDEDPINQKLWDAYNKLEVELQRTALAKALVGQDVYGGGPIDEGRAREIALASKPDRKAGCSMCPCSPGWMLSDQFGQVIGKTFSIKVTRRVTR